MGSLVDFANRIRAQVTRANRQPDWQPGESEQYMAAVAARRKRFEHLAARLTETVIQPRLETLAGFFPNASLVEDQPPGRRACRFGYSERFPSSTTVSFGVEHDVGIERAAVSYHVSMTPLFIKFAQHDRLTRALDELSDEVVAGWVEERLLEFLNAYLQIDRGGDEVEEEPLTDPVCGMRLTRSTAAASGSYFGHPYFFCSLECRDRFLRDPASFAQMKMH